MSKTIDFYFDFVSPYTFISFQQIKTIKFKQNFKFIVFLIVPTASALIIEYLKNETPLKNWKPLGF